MATTALLAAAWLSAAPVTGDEHGATEAPGASDEHEAPVAPGGAGAAVPASDAAGEPAPTDALGGREIYGRVLENRFDAYSQTLRMESGDRGENVQSVRMELKYKSFRENGRNILSKTIARYEMPQDVRHMGYLIINKVEGVDDQFIYRPTSRRVRRVNLRGEAVFGTDFSFEDIIPQELEDGTYNRLPDEEALGRDCYVVEVVPVEDAESEYSRFLAYIDKETFVPIRKLYWDDRGLQIKELRVQPDTITMYEDERKDGVKRIYVPGHSRIENLKLETFTKLVVTELEANPRLKKRDFSQRSLAASH